LRFIGVVAVAAAAVPSSPPPAAATACWLPVAPALWPLLPVALRGDSAAAAMPFALLWLLRFLGLYAILYVEEYIYIYNRGGAALLRRRDLPYEVD
jgi:hypothetical protein